MQDEITLSELKNLRVVNLEEQARIKEEIDEFIYKLYNLTPEEISLIESQK